MWISLPERYALIPLLPQTGNFQTLTRLKNLRTLLTLRDEEMAARRLAIVNDAIVNAGDDTAAGEVLALTEVAMHDELAKLVVATLKECEAREALPYSLLELYERLVREPDNEVVREAEAVVSEAHRA